MTMLSVISPTGLGDLPRNGYSPTERDTWYKSVDRQLSVLRGRAFKGFEEALGLIGLSKDNIPSHTVIQDALTRTRCRAVDVDGKVEDNVFYLDLANKRVCVSRNIRKPWELDFASGPDGIHDKIGHVPQCLHPTIALLLYEVGKMWVVADRIGRSEYVRRLYFHILEGGVVGLMGREKILGAAILSSFREALACIDRKATYVYLDDVHALMPVLLTPVKDNEVQEVYFVIPSVEWFLFAIRSLNLASLPLPSID